MRCCVSFPRGLVLPERGESVAWLRGGTLPPSLVSGRPHWVLRAKPGLNVIACDGLTKILGRIPCLMVIFVIKAAGFIAYGSKENKAIVCHLASYSQRELPFPETRLPFASVWGMACVTG